MSSFLAFSLCPLIWSSPGFEPGLPQPSLSKGKRLNLSATRADAIEPCLIRYVLEELLTYLLLIVKVASAMGFDPSTFWTEGQRLVVELSWLMHDRVL